MKNIVLIRHGESLGQTARSRGVNRKQDESLTDCFLSEKGIYQACGLVKELDDLHNENKFELICTSPLTRAVATCVLGLGHLSGQCVAEESEAVPFLCHPDLAETGDGIPENRGRPIKRVVRTVEENLSFVSPSYAAVQGIDFSLVPSSWPKHHGGVGALAYFMEWLASRPETSIAVVCHHNVIKALLGNACERIPNCVPIQCVLIDGDLRSLHLRATLTEGAASGSAGNTSATKKVSHRATARNENKNGKKASRRKSPKK